jgi:hypothetical protein
MPAWPLLVCPLLKIFCNKQNEAAKITGGLIHFPDR